MSCTVMSLSIWKKALQNLLLNPKAQKLWTIRGCNSSISHPNKSKLGNNELNSGHVLPVRFLTLPMWHTMVNLLSKYTVEPVPLLISKPTTWCHTKVVIIQKKIRLTTLLYLKGVNLLAITIFLEPLLKYKSPTLQPSPRKSFTYQCRNRIL